MFKKGSRYRKVPDLLAVDAKGRRSMVKDCRPLPETDGDFQHIVESPDRLDHLAYRYYREPRKWWNICDANPEFLSPLALLGDESRVTVRFPLYSKQDSPWTDLLPKLPLIIQSLIEAVGVLKVDDILVDGQVNWSEVKKPAGNGQCAEVLQDWRYSLRITYNTQEIDLAPLAAVIETALEKAVGQDKFAVGAPERVERLGKSIIIPPDTLG